jgi:hypothetical protein
LRCRGEYLHIKQEEKMKKFFLAAMVLAVLTAGVVFGQNGSITFQPYLSFDWDPLQFDLVNADHHSSLRAFNFDQSGIKITGRLDKITAYVEVRGFPSGSNEYNPADSAARNNVNSYTKPVYYAWGKYQFTETGNLWAGKFKPLYGPNLFDTSFFGAGWQQKVAGAHTVSGFILQPGFNPGYMYRNSISGGANTPEDSTKGIKLLIMEEFMSENLMLTGGILWDYLPQETTEDANRLYFNVFAAYRGIENLTLTGEAALALYLQKDGIFKDFVSNQLLGEASDTGIGFGIFVAADYKIIEPLSAGISFKLGDPLVGAERNINGTTGQFQYADLGISATYTPARGFFITPGFTLKLENALNDYEPPDGNKVGVDFQLRFRWEPSLRVNF